MEKKSIIIDNRRYELNLNAIGEPGFSGTAYRLKQDELDLAVKIYHSDPPDVGFVYYPKSEELLHFTKIASSSHPILLSQYMVEDINRQYIGCATPFITETRGITEDVFYDLPKDLIFQYLTQIFDKIPYFNQSGIVLDDWSLDNIKLGTIKDGPEALYVFDDSNYFMRAEDNNSDIEEDRDFNDNISYDLMETIVDDYCDKKDISRKVTSLFLREMESQSNPLNYLIQHSSKCESVGEVIEKRAKVLQKKYF